MISIQFFGILILSLLVYWIIPKQYLRNVLLIISSFAFIYLMDKWSLAVVVILTLVSYAFGKLIYNHPKKNWIHLFGVVTVLSALIAFKYLGFLGGILNSLASFVDALPQFEIRNLLLPLGISYIVFKHISYLTDIKWGLVKPGRFIDFLQYSSLFTIFVAGPIERFERFKPQVELNRLPFLWEHIDYGFMRIVFGMFKKLVLADWIGYFIAPIWASPHQYAEFIRPLALIGYSLQIYFDFAGYSDIAIGSSRLFGFKIMENFNNPYLAPNISQFWRRWHISLSDWIRDYLFFPLSKISSKKTWQIFFVPVIAMALCGLWHGPAWHFMLWGIWHGIGLSILQVWNQYKRKHKPLAKATRSSWFMYAGIVMNFAFVTLGWWWFR
ncbi:MAG: MBOAT family O-acyltransferase [Gammaproteobacteria bacterium]